MVAKPFEFAAYPVHKAAFQAPQDGCQGRRIISTIIIHPTAYERIDERRDLFEALVVASRTNPPRTDRGTDGISRLGAHAREKADKQFAPAVLGSTWTKRVAQEVELGMFMRAASVIVFAVHDLGLLRMELQAASPPDVVESPPAIPQPLGGCGHARPHHRHSVRIEHLRNYAAAIHRTHNA